MKADEFIHILTRIVNTKHGARFLEIVHDLRKVLEAAGIAEEVGPKIEPGKPLRQRSPEDISKKPKMSFPAPPRLPEIDIPALEAGASPAAAPAADPSADPASAEGEARGSAEPAGGVEGPAPVTTGGDDGHSGALPPPAATEDPPLAGEDAGTEESTAPGGPPGRGFRLIGGRPSRRGRPRKMTPSAPEGETAPEESPTAPDDTASDDTAPAGEAPPDEHEVVEAPGAATEEDAVDESLVAETAPPPEEFIAAGPNRLIRNPDAHPPRPEPPASKGSRKESVRSIVLEALQEGNKTMGELEEFVRGRKGTVPHLYQQTYLALKRIGALKDSSGRFTISTKDAVGPAVEEGAVPAPTQLNLLDGLPPAGDGGKGEGSGEGSGNGNGNGSGE